MLRRWFKGDPWAVAMLLDLGFITQVWDDAVDGDRVLTRDAVDGAFIRALCGLPRNPFWLRHQADLLPLLEAWIVDWQTATTIEQGPSMDPTLMRVAWLIRDSSAGLIVACARIIGGWEWAQDVAMEVRAHLHDEPFDNYARGIDRPPPHAPVLRQWQKGMASEPPEVGHG